MNADGEVTRFIIGCAIQVSRSLGCGFLERVYETALTHELRKRGAPVEVQRLFAVVYDGIVVEQYRADLVVAEHVIVEIKATRSIDSAHMAQVLNYLRATRLHTGLILNFGTPRLGIKRLII